MSVLIGNAVCDEHGKARGGEPGNQTGRELRIQPWYKNTKGWRVFRPLSKETADLLAYDMRAACENMKIGYNQSKRNTLYPLAEKVNFDCADVSTPCECDCSSLVRVCLAYAGIRTANFNTVSEPSRLLATGKFEELTDRAYTDSPDRLRAGDILITAPSGKKLRNIKTEAMYSEVICDEKHRDLYVVADSPEDPVVETLDGVTLGERVSDLEDAVVELAEIISEVE